MPLSTDVCRCQAAPYTIEFRHGVGERWGADWRRRGSPTDADSVRTPFQSSIRRAATKHYGLTCGIPWAATAGLHAPCPGAFPSYLGTRIARSASQRKYILLTLHQEQHCIKNIASRTLHQDRPRLWRVQVTGKRALRCACWLRCFPRSRRGGLRLPLLRFAQPAGMATPRPWDVMGLSLTSRVAWSSTLVAWAGGR